MKVNPRMRKRIFFIVFAAALAAVLISFIGELSGLNKSFFAVRRACVDAFRRGDFADGGRYASYYARLFCSALYEMAAFRKDVDCGPRIDNKLKKDWITAKERLAEAVAGSKVTIETFDNKDILTSPFAFRYLDYSSPHACSFVRENNLDEVISGASSDFESITRLLHWAHTRWRGHYSSRLDECDVEKVVAYKNKSFSAFDILRYDAPLNKIDCVAAGYLFTQAMAAMGYQARIIYVADHVACEAWSDDYEKWFFADPYYDVYFLKDNVPLDWFEMHNLLKTSKALWDGNFVGSFKDVIAFYAKYGIEVKSSSFDGKIYDGPTEGGSFHFLANHVFGPVFAVHLRNDHLENVYPDWHVLYHKYPKTNVLWRQAGINYEDIRINEMWQSPIPHSRKEPVDIKNNLPFNWQVTDDVKDLYWSINSTRIYINPDVHIEGQKRNMEILLDTFTPNFSSFYISVDGKEWTKSPARFVWRLSSGENVLKVRAGNEYGHYGAISEIAVRMIN